MPQSYEQFKAKQNARRRARVEAGVCKTCGEEVVPDKGYCPRHYVQRLLIKARGDYGQWRNREWVKEHLPQRSTTMAEADQLLQQLHDHPFCAYSGLPIDITTAELDHRVPVARCLDFPDVDVQALDNLCWVHTTINRMKYNLTEAELVDVCSKVVALKTTQFRVTVHARVDS